MNLHRYARGRAAPIQRGVSRGSIPRTVPSTPRRGRISANRTPNLAQGWGCGAILGRVDNLPAWEYTPGLETYEQYSAFQYYRDLGPRRTFSRTARDLTLAYPTVVRWASGCLWNERCESYDQHRERERAAARVRAEAHADQDWAKRRAEVLADLEELWADAAGKIRRGLVNGSVQVTPQALVQIGRLLLHFGNLAAGDATERVDVDGQIDYSNLSDAELVQLHELLAKGKSE